jgi:hypothetical protein
MPTLPVTGPMASHFQRAALILTLQSATDLTSPRIRKHDQASANRWHLQLRLTAPAEVDTEVRKWLAAALRAGGLASRGVVPLGR